MAVPKKKKSHAASARQHSKYVELERKRLSNITNVVTCKECGAEKLNHTVCKKCGTYKWVKVLEIKKSVKAPAQVITA